MKNGDKQSRSTLVLMTVLLIVVLIVVGLFWYFGGRDKSNDDDQQDNTDSSDQIDQTENEAEEQPGGSKKLEQADLDAIVVAISSKQYDDLSQYLADNVEVVFAASEFGDKRTKEQVVTDLEYLNSATSPWDFRLPEEELNKFYGSELYGKFLTREDIIGQSANGYVVSVAFSEDSTGEKISRIFAANDYKILQ